MAARKSTTTPAKTETVVEKVADICRACWPHGWPHLSHSASCEHGTYVRVVEPVIEQTPDKEPTPPAVTPDGGSPETMPPAPPAGDKTEEKQQ